MLLVWRVIKIKVFTFKEREAYSLSHSDALNKFYREHWDVNSIEIVYDKERQTKGIDKILHLKDGTTLNIDEKIESIKETNNIVFEDKTNIENDTDGWLKEGQLTDLVVFYQVEMKKVYVIPFDIMLQELKECRDEWAEDGFERVIVNKTKYGYYKCRIFIVPKPEVFNYLQDHTDFELSDFEYNFSVE